MSRFPHEGPVVDAYRKRLKSYAACLMGRRTYEFGYRFGLPAGANPYPDMHSYVLSASLELPENSEVQLIGQGISSFLQQLKKEAAGPIYLCGGGALAGSMRDLKLIDLLRVKRAAVLLGSGVRLFGACDRPAGLRQTDVTAYEDGTVYQEFELLHE